MGSNSPSFADWFIAGGAAGFTADLLFFPVDTIKTRLQSAQGFLRAGGFSGMYQGIGGVLVGSVPGAAVFFATYDTLKKHLPLPPHLDPVNHVVSASVAEVASCIIYVPVEVIKTRTQTSVYGEGAVSSLVAARRTFRAEGIRGFYRGFGITIGCWIPFTSIQFPVYEALKAHLASYFHPKTRYGHDAALSGFVASGIAAALTTPLDVLKTRVMLDMRDNTKVVRPTFSKHLKEIYKRESLRVLFAGVFPRIIWVSASGAVFLGVYERVMSGLLDKGTQSIAADSVDSIRSLKI